MNNYFVDLFGGGVNKFHGEHCMMTKNEHVKKSKILNSQRRFGEVNLTLIRISNFNDLVAPFGGSNLIISVVINQLIY